VGAVSRLRRLELGRGRGGFSGQPAGGVVVAALLSRHTLRDFLHPRASGVRAPAFCLKVPAVGVEQQHTDHRSQSVDAAIADGGRPARLENLVVFVGQRIKSGAQNGEASPPQAPCMRPIPFQGVIKKEAKDRVFGQVRRLPQHRMKQLERRVRHVDVEQSEDVFEQPGGERRTECVRRKVIDDSRPDKRGKPKQEDAEPRVRGGGIEEANQASSSGPLW